MRVILEAPPRGHPGAAAISWAARTRPPGWFDMSTRKLTLDLHPIYNKRELIDAALERAMEEAEERKASELEIICGKGSGALKKRVLRYLDRKHVRARYHRINKDPGNHGRLFVYFRWSRGQ
jgi:DNA-nicking Smr family endonuclease